MINAFLGAVVLWMALPPLDWWPLAWVAPVPWVLLIRRRELSGRRPYAVLALAGFCFWMAALHWLRLPHPATGIGWFALSFYFAFYLPVFVGLSRVAVHRIGVPVILAAPMVWTGLELARGHLLTGMLMGSLSHTQYHWIVLIQISDLAGEYGVGFVVVCVAAALARMLPCDGRRWAVWPLVPALGLLAAVLGYGYVRTAGDYTSPGPRVALIQGSIDVEFIRAPDPDEYQRRVNERNLRMYAEYLGLAKEAVKQYPKLDLVVWPESMFPRPLFLFDPDATKPPDDPGDEARFRASLQAATEWSSSLLTEVAGQIGVPLIVGIDTYHYLSKVQRVYASAGYVGRDGKLLGRYDKNHLVLFGEYVPFTQYFPWLQRLTPLPINATPGEKAAAFDVGRFRVAPNICFESVLPHVIRRLVNELTAEGKGPDVLVNLTNDGWFWGSSELDMHLACAVFRAVECRKPFLIAANTGFSAWIDSDGRIRRQGPRRAAGTILAETQIDRRSSWYLCHGDWFSGVCLAVCVVFGAVGFMPTRRLRRTSPCDDAPQ